MSKRITCPTCHSKATKHGKTSSGRQRWRCSSCKLCFTINNADAVEAKWFRVFMTWITSGLSLEQVAAQHNVSTRTLHRRFENFWLIHPPQPVDEHRIYDQIFIDGTYFNGMCLLVAATTDHIVCWHWCYREDSHSYTKLLDQIPGPRIVTTDGQAGALKAIRTCWKDTKIQRCIIHVKRNVQHCVGLRPVTDCGKALRRLSLSLLRVDDLDKATQWVTALHNFGNVFHDYLNERTYLKDVDPADIPRSKRHNKAWWYTHDKHRKAYKLLVKLVNKQHLFTFLTQAEAANLVFKPTTNSLEGGANSPLKDLLHTHRGMVAEHQRIICQWWLYLHTQLPDDPVEIARQQNWGKNALAKVHTLTNQEKQAANGREDGAPATYDNAIDADYTHSIGIRKGQPR